MASRLRTEIMIDAPPHRVWDVLTDFAAYPDWNPFIRRISGSPRAGEQLDVHLQPPGGRGTTMRPTVVASDPDREFRWLGHLGVRGLFDGEHTFRIEPLGENRVRFVQEERFTGLLAPVIMRFIGADTERGFTAMNEALKLRVEQLQGRES